MPITLPISLTYVKRNKTYFQRNFDPGNDFFEMTFMEGCPRWHWEIPDPELTSPTDTQGSAATCGSSPSEKDLKTRRTSFRSKG